MTRHTHGIHRTWGGRLLVGGLLVAVVQVSAAAADDWPQWGGPNRDFITHAAGLANTWPATGPKRLWQRRLGPGYSSIVVGGDKLFTMYRDGQRDVITALWRKNGETAWEHRYNAEPHTEQKLDFGTGPNATPLLLEDRLVTVGFTGQMTCMDRQHGVMIWHHDLVQEFGGKIQEFGYSASPLLYDGKIITLVGGEKNGVIAFDPEDGSVAWKSEPLDISYASPIVINVDGQDQIVFMSSTEVIGLDAADGRFLWKSPCINRYKNNATDPLWGKDNLLWVATQLDGGTRVLKLSRQGDKTNVEQVWFNKKIKIFHWNAVRLGDVVYASIGNNTTTLAAIEVKTGNILWRQRGFHKAQCTYADDKLIFLDENGKLAMAKVSPQGIDMLAETQLTQKVSWTAPTLVDHTLYVRDTKHVFALDLGKP